MRQDTYYYKLLKILANQTDQNISLHFKNKKYIIQTNCMFPPIDQVSCDFWIFLCI